MALAKTKLQQSHEIENFWKISTSENSKHKFKQLCEILLHFKDKLTQEHVLNIKDQLWNKYRSIHRHAIVTHEDFIINETQLLNHDNAYYLCSKGSLLIQLRKHINTNQHPIF